MRQKTRWFVPRTALALMGAFVGAGFASGRELFDFFLIYGTWGLAGMVLAAALLGLLIARLLCATRDLPSVDALCARAFSTHRHPHPWLPGILLSLFMWINAAAMLGGLQALLEEWLRPLPAMLLTVCLCAAAVATARGKLTALSALGGVLLPLLFCVVILLRQPQGALPAQSGYALEAASPLRALGMAVRYAALNIALSVGVFPVLAANCARKAAAQVGLLCGLLLLALLLLSARTFLPNIGALWNAPLPAMTLAAARGSLLRIATAVLLGLAMISTLLAALRGMADTLGAQGFGAWSYPIAGALSFGLSRIGFQRIIGLVYPALGGIALALVMLLCLLPLIRGKRAECAGERKRMRTPKKPARQADAGHALGHTDIP